MVCDASFGILSFTHWTQQCSDAKKTAVEKAEEADAEILAAIASRKKLASDLELAKGIAYTESRTTSCVAVSFTPEHGTDIIMGIDGDHLDSSVKQERSVTNGFARSIIFSWRAPMFLPQSSDLRFV